MGIFEDLKSIGKVLQEAGKIDLYQKIREIQEKLSEYQKKIQNLEEENKELKEKLKIKENLIFENNVYWLKRENGNKDGPFCTRCWDKDNKLIRLYSSSHEDLYGRCLECGNRFQIKPGSYSPYKPKKFNEYL